MKTNHTKVVEKDATSKEKDFKEQKRTQKEMERISQEVVWEQGPFESQDAEELNKEFGVTEYEIKNSN